MPPVPERVPSGRPARLPAGAAWSPSALLLGGGGLALGLAAGLPVVAAAAVGVTAYGARLAVAWLRAPRPPRIDPFTLREPWRHHVRHALQAQARYRRAVADVAPGPLQERLDDIGRRVDAGVQACWRIARRGHELEDALGLIRPASVERQLDGGAADEPTAAALEAQLSSADRLRRVAAEAADRLRVLEARLDEAVARAVEVSFQAGGDGVSGIGTAVDEVVDELEALRAALEETGRGPTEGLP